MLAVGFKLQPKRAEGPQAEGWTAVAEGQTEARSAEGPSEQRAVRQPDPSEASGQPQKKKRSSTEVLDL